MNSPNSTRPNRPWKDLFTIIGITLLLTFLGLEGSYRIFGLNRHTIAEGLRWPFHDTTESALGKPLQSKDYVLRDHEGRILQTATMELDQWGRRRMPERPEATRFHLLFGCSFTFGVGLNQEDTLGDLLSGKSDSLVHVYARPGFSPANFLYQVETLDLVEQIGLKPVQGDAFYIFYDFQWPRVRGGYTWVAQETGKVPIYLENPSEQRLEWRGSFAETYPVRAQLYSLLRHLHLTRYLIQPRVFDFSQEDQKLFCDLFNQSYRSLKEKLGERLDKLVIVAPSFPGQTTGWEIVEFSRPCLNPDIQVLYPASSKGMHEMVIHPNLDPHPNREFNQWLVDEILKN